jgi:NAD(P)-dependent dehydrogenase (short-subunit alcohol dehydrogenase family)
MRALVGQSALVTGAGRGIGKALALRLAAEGAYVTLTARTLPQLKAVAAEINSHGGQALPVAADVTDDSAVHRVAAAASERFGPVSVLVNNAGLGDPFGPVGDIDPLEWWATQKVHVLGSLLFMRSVIPGMRARGGGRIINIVSRAGLQPIPNMSAYAVAKCTAIRLIEQVDLEERPNNVRAFALQPGTIITDMALETMASPEAQRYIPEGIAMLRGLTPGSSDADLQRTCEVVTNLASGSYDALAGQYLDIAWDLEAKLVEQRGR